MRPLVTSCSHGLLACVLAAGGGRASAVPGVQSRDRPDPSSIAVASDGRRFVISEVIVGYTSPQDLGALQASLERLGFAICGEIPRLQALKLRVPTAAEETAAALLRALPGVRYAELDAVGAGGGVPDDTYFPRQYHLDNTGQSGGTRGADIEALAAWSIQTGDPSVVLAVLDTGIDFFHPEFIGRTRQGYDFVNEDADPTADHPHGVWVTGLAAASTHNAFGVAGVDRACTILPVKVLNQSNGGTTFDLAQGLDFCAAFPAHVVNLSLINYPESDLLKDAVQAARDAGCILVACAGNGGIGDAERSWPGASPKTISIGATDDDDARAGFSGTGKTLDFVAPGVDCVTVEDDHRDDFDLFTGCSAATPVASGITCLLKARFPKLTHRGAHALLRAGAEDQVGKASEDLPGWDEYHGYGRLNAARSLDALGLEGAPKRPGEGDLVRLTTHGGQPGGAVVLFIVEVDGAPVWIALDLSTFDADGLHSAGGTVPPGLTGVEFGLRSFGFALSGSVRASNLETIAVQ